MSRPRAAVQRARLPEGPIVCVQNRVGRKGIPTTASFERWVRAALTGARRRPLPRARPLALNIALFDATSARGLNRRDRGRDYATNVLSYPYEPLPRERSGLLGDLVICPAVVRREARAQRKTARDHFAHLTVHGVLHLAGYDHESDADAEDMEALERRILARLGIPDPYAAGS